MSTKQCNVQNRQNQSIDFVAALLLTILKSSGGAKIKGRSFDLKSAYKQLAIAESSLQFAFVAVYNPYKRKAEVYQLLATPFGATRSVCSFLRISHAIWYTGVKALKIMWSVFFDDYVVFPKRAMSTIPKLQWSSCSNCWVGSLQWMAIRLLVSMMNSRRWECA